MPVTDPPQFSDPISWVWLPGWFLTIIAILGNAMVVYLIARNRRLRTQVNVFIMSLAIADLFFSLSYFPAFFTCEFYLPCDRQLRRIFAAYFAYASLTNLCVMTADRYVAIVMPFEYVSFMTLKCVVTMVIVSWLFPAVFYFLIAIILKQMASEDIVNNFNIVRVFVFQIAPCFSLLLATIRMIFITYKHSRKMAAIATQLQFNHAISYKKRKGFEISSAGFIGVVVFFTVLYYLVDSYFDLRFLFVSSFRNAMDTDYALCLLFITNSAVNPLAYALFKHDIRKEVKRLFFYKCRKPERVHGTDIVLKSYLRVLAEPAISQICLQAT